MLRAVTTQGFNTALKGRVPLARMAAARGRMLADGLNNITAASGNNSLNSRASYYSPRDAALTDIVLSFAGFYNAQPEANFPLTYTAYASIEYPAGTFTVVRFAGATSQTVTPGYVTYYSDPTPVRIPANTQFWVKVYLSWTGGATDFPLTSVGVTALNGDWTNVGTGLTNQTTSVTTYSSTYAAPTFVRGMGVTCGVFGRLSASIPVLGIIGDSIDQGSGGTDTADATYGGISWERGFRNVVPLLNVARQAETAANFWTRPNGRLSLLADACTHVMIGYGRNDLNAGTAVATFQADIIKIVDYFLSRGVKVFLRTITPQTTSTDGWITTANQTVANATYEARRLTYNQNIRDNWGAWGLSGYFDVARIVDPTDSGKWNVDDGKAGYQAYGVPTLTAGVVTAVDRPTLNAGTAYGGTGYANNESALTCYVYRRPDDPIRTGDATVTCATNGSGVVTGYTVVSGGTYTYAPMITPAGVWTADGIHPSARSYNAIIAGASIGPQALAL